jgi:hypothetical protein
MKLMEEGRSIGLQKQEGLQYFLVITQLLFSTGEKHPCCKRLEGG